jgi:hypothetical protein
VRALSIFTRLNGQHAAYLEKRLAALATLPLSAGQGSTRCRPSRPGPERPVDDPHPLADTRGWVRARDDAVAARRLHSGANSAQNPLKAVRLFPENPVSYPFAHVEMRRRKRDKGTSGSRTAAPVYE